MGSVIFLVVLFGATFSFTALLWRKYADEDRAAAKERRQALSQRKPAPIAVTREGEPVYPVAGYTGEGRAVTTDQLAGGSASWHPRTNTNAVIAFVLAFVLAPVAIPFGHTARREIKESGERGGGLALAALILGYLGLFTIAAVVVLILVAHQR